MNFKAISYITMKKRGMLGVCHLLSKKLEAEAKQTAPWSNNDKDVKTQNARQGLNGGCGYSGNDYSIYLAHGVDYGEILEEGSRPHIIKAKNEPYLCFKTKDGYWRKAKQVKHPGTKGFRHIENTLEGNRQMIKSELIKYWSD